MEKTEHIKLLEKEITEVIDYCLSSGLTSEQLRQCAKPLIAISTPPEAADSSKLNKKVKNKSWMKTLVTLSVVVAVIAVLFQWPSTSYRWLSICGKCIAVKIVLPFWDWTAIHKEECMLYNPYQIEANLTEEDCEVCEDYGSIERVNKISHDSMTEEYLFYSIPVIVTDAAQDWRATQEFNIDFIKQLYKTDSVLSKFDLCRYETATDHRFVKIRDENIDNFHIHWENCAMESMKAFRTYYSRPYFLPPMVEMGAINIVAMATPVGDIPAGEGHHRFLEYSSEDTLTWFSQVRGQYLIKLDPRSPCDKICQSLHFVLKEGETLVLHNDMWIFQFAPYGDGPSVALGATGTWDE